MRENPASGFTHKLTHTQAGARTDGHTYIQRGKQQKAYAATSCSAMRAHGYSYMSWIRIRYWVLDSRTGHGGIPTTFVLSSSFLCH